MTTHSLPRFPHATRRHLLVTAGWLLSLAALLWLPATRFASVATPSANVVDTDASGGEARTATATLSTNPAVRQQGQHLSRLGVQYWHAHGYRGQGVKVAVLDTGFRGWRTYLGGALPGSVKVRSFRDDGNLEAKDSIHGILVGEVIHAIAPDAELMFANWELHRADQFLAAVRWAREQGAKIISCSVVTPNWSDGDGGGVIHEELAKLLRPSEHSKDMLCFASAGNTSDRHWGGRFRDGGNGFHAWKTGITENALRPWGKDPISVEMYWHPGADYDLFVYDAENGREVGHAITDHNRGDRYSAVVRFLPEEGHSYRVRVKLVRGPAGDFHMTSMFGSIEHTTLKSSVCFPADGATVVGMGAVDEQGQRQWYSACGPNSRRPKPDYVAVVPFPTLIRERGFGGTSAAAPQGSALAALWWSRHPGWTADQVWHSLGSTVQDLGPPGPDVETGFGLIHLPQE